MLLGAKFVFCSSCHIPLGSVEYDQAFSLSPDYYIIS